MIRVKVKIIFLVLCLIIPYSIAGDVVTAVKIIKFDKNYNFMVVDQGQIHGIEPGMDFIIVRDGVEVGKLEVVKVKDNVSACDIIELIDGVSFAEDDVITIYPIGQDIGLLKATSSLGQREVESVEGPLPQAKGGFWSRVFRDSDEESIPDDVKGRSIQELLWAKELKGSSISMDVFANKDTAFYVLREIMEEEKIIVTHSNRINGMLTAFKMVPMSIAEEIFADFRGLKEKKLVYDIVVRENGPNTVTINVDLKYITYNKKDAGKVKSLNSGKAVREIYSILRRVKTKAEKIQAEWGG